MLLPGYEDVALPGLEYSLSPPPGATAVRRAYSPDLTPTADAIGRFWTHVVSTPDCALWVGAISGGDGYGRFSWRANSLSRTMSAHRFALLLAHGDHEAGTVAEHRCNEPLCVRVDPAHVIASTQSANLRYAVACGRAGHPRTLAAPADRHARSLAVRAAVSGGWNAAAYAAASGITPPPEHPTLF